MKQYVEVFARFDTDGRIIPLAVKIGDEKFEVDRVRDIFFWRKPSGFLSRRAECVAYFIIFNCFAPCFLMILYIEKAL